MENFLAARMESADGMAWAKTVENPNERITRYLNETQRNTC
ncbi:MAG: hypothetical protein DKINENOH_00310 [bacterium]|nr:hypothetical protein [bacterium]